VRGCKVSPLLRFLFLLDLLSLSAAFRLPETRLLGVIATDYFGFVVFYRLARTWRVRIYAEQCQKLVTTYNVSDAVAKKLVSYWNGRFRQ
jgi:hypothetical protein